MIILLSAVSLLLLAVPLLRGARLRLSLAVLIAVLATGSLTWQQRGFANPCDRESSYFCLRVVDASDQVPFGSARAMVLDHLLHGINHASEPGMLVGPYVHLMQELVDRHFDDEPQRRRQVHGAARRGRPAELEVERQAAAGDQQPQRNRADAQP